MTTELWAYHAENTVRIMGDYRSQYWPGLIVRLVQGGNEKFFRITNVTYDGQFTYLELHGGGIYTLSTDPITEHQHSPFLAPKGFPISFDLMPQYLTDSDAQGTYLSKSEAQNTYLKQSDHASTSLHTPGSVVPVTQSIPSSGGSDQIPSAAAIRSHVPKSSIDGELLYGSGGAWIRTGNKFKLLDNCNRFYVETDNILECLNIANIKRYTSTGSYWTRSQIHSSRPVVSPGVTLTGDHICQEHMYFRNWTGDDDSGTMDEFVGLRVLFGHHEANPNANPQTLHLHGISVIPFLFKGYANEVRAISLAWEITSGGSAGSRWGIYQEDNRYNNYFAGNVCIKTTNTGAALILGVDSAVKPSTNTWTVSSDRRLKENITDADLDRCLEIVKQLPLRRFTWKDEYMPEEAASDRSKLGWIADEVEPVFPKAVRVAPFVKNKIIKKTQTDENGNEYEVEETVSETVIEDCKYLDSDQIIAALYGAVQKLIQIVEEQQGEIDALRSMIDGRVV